VIKAIETTYAGIKFRSRLEARWAVIFDQTGISWTYEPEGYRLSDGQWYLPDFYLTDLDVWVEVKGAVNRLNVDLLARAAIDLPRRRRDNPTFAPDLLILGDVPNNADRAPSWIGLYSFWGERELDADVHAFRVSLERGTFERYWVVDSDLLSHSHPSELWDSRGPILARMNQIAGKPRLTNHDMDIYEELESLYLDDSDSKTCRCLTGTDNWLRPIPGSYLSLVTFEGAYSRSRNAFRYERRTP
jgi:hypothetical protein